MHTLTFARWLRAQEHRGDAVGEVARWTLGEVEAGRLDRVPARPTVLREHARRCGTRVTPRFLADIRAAGAEWSSTLTHRSEA